VLNALGGNCLEDFDRLREDVGLKEMLGHEMPSPEAARKFLYQFHDDKVIEQAQAELPAGQVSYIPNQSERLRGLAQVNRELVMKIGERCADQRIATIDLDATVIRKLETRGTEDLSGGDRIPAHAGTLGGTGPCPGVRIPSWQCACRLSTIAGGKACLSGIAGNREGILFSRRLGLLGALAGELAARRRAQRGTERANHVRHQRTDDSAAEGARAENQ
jgi:hypothetical protein